MENITDIDIPPPIRYYAKTMNIHRTFGGTCAPSVAVRSNADWSEGDSDVSTSSRTRAGSTPGASTRNENRPAINGRPTTQKVDTQHRSGDESGAPPPPLDRGRVATGTRTVVRHGLTHVGQPASIAMAGSPSQPSTGGRRFTDPALTGERINRRVMMADLAFVGRGAHRVGEALPAATPTPKACDVAMRGC
jgi:hypothetical protein